MNQIKVGAVLSYVSIFMGSLISLVYTPYMLRLLGTSEYGLMSLANSVVGYLGLLNLGLGSAMVRYISKYRAEKNHIMEEGVITLFLIVFGIIAVLVVICGFLLTINVHDLFDRSLTTLEFHRLQILMILMTFNIAIGMISSVFYAIIMSYERFIFTKIVGIIYTALSPIIMLVLLYQGYRSVGMTLASTILNVLNLLVIIYYCFVYLRTKLHYVKFESSFLKELFGFSFFVLMAMIVDKVYWGTDQFVLGVVSGTKAVAIYNIGSTFTTYFMSFSTAIIGLFLPRLTQMEVQKVTDEDFTLLFIKVGRIQFIILGFVLGAFILLGRPFIRLWAGIEYYESFWIALVILIPFIVPLIQNLGLQLMYARNLHKFRSITLFIIAIFNVLFTIPFAQKYGGLGAALVTGISFIIGQIIILNWFYYRKMRINIPLFWKEIAKLTLPLTGTMIVVGFVLSNMGNLTWTSLTISAFVYACVYIGVIWCMGMNSYEKEIFYSVFKKK